MGRVRYWLFKKLFRREISELETEIDEEFRFHLEMKAETLRAEGMRQEEAEAAAMQRFGDPEELREACVKGLCVRRGTIASCAPFGTPRLAAPPATRYYPGAKKDTDSNAFSPAGGARRPGESMRSGMQEPRPGMRIGTVRLAAIMAAPA